jgi:hypothetical protein
VRIGKPEEAVKCKSLIFGAPGGGKTYFLGTLEDDERTKPTLLLDFEGGVQTLVGRDVDVATIGSWQDYNEAYRTLADPQTKYRSVGVDSLSETQAGGLLSILEDGGKRPDPDILAVADWGKILVQMRRFVRSFKALDMHVFMTALAGEDLDRDEGKVKVPLLQGGFAKEAPGIFDIVGYMGKQTLDSGESERILLLQNFPGFRIKARTRMGVIAPDSISKPTATLLLDALGYE